MTRRRKLPGPRNRFVTVERDDKSGTIGPRGNREPNWIVHADGWACVFIRAAAEPLGVGGQARPEQVLDVRGFRPSATARILPGMRILWDDRDWRVYGVEPVYRGAPGEVDILATDHTTASVTA